MFEKIVSSIWTFLTILVDVVFYWVRVIANGGKMKIREREANEKLKNCATQKEWMAIAEELDKIRRFDKWRDDPVSPEYDYALIEKRLLQLRKMRENQDFRSLIFLLRSGLSRNLGGIGNPRLFEFSLLGTKRLIEEYVDELSACFEMIAEWDPHELSVKQKIEFFAGLRQVYGRSALLLSGGATLGLYHIGVVRCLFNNGLLPRIFSGSSVGSLMAALFCTKTDEELPHYFDVNNVNLEAIERRGEGTTKRRITRLLKKGYLFDIEVLQECIRSNVGDYTFLEAYNRTRRVLNITVSSSTVYEMPRLLNYLTAPNVLIWSAASASCAIPGLYQPVPLMAKASDGSIVPWNPAGSLWVDGSVENDLPMARLSEQFNVNHFIVSQVNPHVVPFLQKSNINSKASLISRIKYLLTSEISHRFNQVVELGLFPPGIQRSFYWSRMILSQKYHGDITIVPPIGPSDYLGIMSNPDIDEVTIKINKAEKATWEKLPIIRMHFQTEKTLDNILYRLRVRQLEKRGKSYRPVDFALALGVEEEEDIKDHQTHDQKPQLYRRSSSLGSNMAEVADLYQFN